MAALLLSLRAIAKQSRATNNRIHDHRIQLWNSGLLETEDTSCPRFRRGGAVQVFDIIVLEGVRNLRGYEIANLFFHGSKPFIGRHYVQFHAMGDPQAFFFFYQNLKLHRPMFLSPHISSLPAIAP
jgi:hypothetical protein